jgi:hypothetical protein
MHGTSVYMLEPPVMLCRAGMRPKWRVAQVVILLVLVAVATALALSLKASRSGTLSTATPEAKSVTKSHPDASTTSDPTIQTIETTREAAEEHGSPAAVRMYTYEVVRALPHDAKAFTQGLEYEKYKGREVFWESTGIYGKSQVREVRF